MIVGIVDMEGKVEIDWMFVKKEPRNLAWWER